MQWLSLKYFTKDKVSELCYHQEVDILGLEAEWSVRSMDGGDQRPGFKP